MEKTLNKILENALNNDELIKGRDKHTWECGYLKGLVIGLAEKFPEVAETLEKRLEFQEEKTSLSYEEIQERISMLCDQAIEESNTSGCDINSIKKIEKEIDALEELRESKPEWRVFLKEVAEARKTEELPF